MNEYGVEQLRVVLQTAEAAARLCMELVGRIGQRVLQVPLDPMVAPLLGLSSGA
jgi:hypothetical protein